MRILPDEKLDFDDVLLMPKVSDIPSRDPRKGGADLSRRFTLPHSGIKYEGVPIMASNMDGVGTFSMAKILAKHRMFTVIRKHYTLDEWENAIPDLDLEHLAVCTGTGAIFDRHAPDFKLVRELTERYPIRYICIDVANGYQVNFERFVDQVRTMFPTQGLIAGNVCTYEMAERLVHNLGVDIVKLGIGPGSSCTTRIHTGVGNPQLSTIIECADAAHGVNGRVIADGGCRTSGDIAKAFCAGADFVMLGGMLAFHNESEIEAGEDGMIEFYGMSSDRAMEIHGRRKDGYRSPEGKVVKRQNRGPVEDTVQDILGRLGSSCTYIGAKEIREMTIRATFAKVRRTHNTVFGDEL